AHRILPDVLAWKRHMAVFFPSEPRSGDLPSHVKHRPGYANFAIAEPPLKLVLIEGEEGKPTRMDHLGVEVEETAQVDAATQRLKNAGLATFEENDTSCCYALQDKVWVHGPGGEPWGVYVVKSDADTPGAMAAPEPTCAS